MTAISLAIITFCVVLLTMHLVFFDSEPILNLSDKFNEMDCEELYDHVLKGSAQWDLAKAHFDLRCDDYILD